MKLRINKHKEKPKIFSVITIIGWLLTLVSIFVTMATNTQYRYLVILPIAYSLSRIWLNKAYYQVAPGLVTYEVVSFFRFVVLPLTILLQGSLNIFAIDYNYMGFAVALMIYELVMCSFVIIFYHPKHKGDEASSYYGGNRKLIFLLVVGAVLLLYMDNRSLTGNFRIFQGVNNRGVEEQLSDISGGISILWQALWTYLFAYIIWTIYNESEKKSVKTGSAIISALVCIIYYLVMFTGQVSISRWYVLIIAIASIVWLCKLYPHNKWNVLITIGIPFAFVFLYVTVIKNLGVDALSLNRSQQLIQIITPTSMDAYFAGPVSVNNAIGLKQNTHINIESMVYDFVNNMPIVNNYVDSSLSSVGRYHAYLHRGDQILPLIGQSISWFGYLLAPILSMLSVAIFMKADAAFSDSIGIDTYAYAFWAAWCGAVTILNMTIWLAWIYIRIIPMFLLFFFAKNMAKARSANKE